MKMPSILKRLAVRALPENVLQITKKLYYRGRLQFMSQTDEIDFCVIKYLIKRGDEVVDIGANIGFYTKYMSELVGDSGRVYSIEPIPLTCDILENNVRRLRLRNVELINCAISDEDGYVTMEVPLYKWGGENYYQAKITDHVASKSLRRVRVISKTLDTLLLEADQDMSFIKCDVEGHELKCIMGARKLIERSQPAWLIEIWEGPDKATSGGYEIVNMLRALGYEAWWYDGRNLRGRRPGDKALNYYFLAARHVQALKERGVLE